MKNRMNIFSKIVILVILLLVPIIILYSFSNHVSVNVLENEIKIRNLNRLSIFRQQIDTEIDKLSYLLLNLSADPDISVYKTIDLYKDYEALQIKSRIFEKMNLHRVQSNWISDISIYSVNAQEAIGTSQVKYDEEYLRSQVTMGWKLTEIIKDGKSQLVFIRHVVQPFSTIYDLQSTQLIIEVKFPVDNIQTYLKQLKDSLGAPFFYLPGQKPITREGANMELVDRITGHIDADSLSREGSFTVDMGGSVYLVSFVRSNILSGGILFDYVPIETILSPIKSSNILFYTSVALLLAMSLLASLLLYRNVHRPIRQLMYSMKRLKQGNYDIRLKLGANPEFDFLFFHFNQMADQIQNLIVKVYEEKINAHEATLKQLQAQINPHFLYNCLFYIKNMAKIGNDEAVEAMALHLGQYYRYTINADSEMVILNEELELVVNYLGIFSLRMQRIQYEIDVPESMRSIRVPRLILQPIVENALIHGIEPKPGNGNVKISGRLVGDEVCLTIEDNGVGMSLEALSELQKKIHAPRSLEMGCGVWNVHQRLVYQFGEPSGLQIFHSSSGGLRVELFWKLKADRELQGR